MDIKTLLNNLHEEVSCSVCMNTFTDPKTLPCLHSFCLHCLRGIQRTSCRHDTISCPECRRETRISSGNLDALPTNFRINSLLDVLAIKQCDTTEAKCGNCNKKNAHSFYCFQCCVFWCDDCIVHHNGLQVNKKHRVLALKDFQEEDFADILKRPVFCQKQGHEKKELEFFCRRCEIAICSSCVATTHEGHSKILLEEASKECELQIKCYFESRKQAIRRKESDIAKLDENCNKIQAQVTDVKRKVQAFSDNIITAVAAKKEEIFNEVENQAKEALERLGTGKSEFKQQLETMNGSVGRTEAVLKRNSSVELIQFNKSLHTFPPEESDGGDVVDCESESLCEFVYVENEKVLNDILSEGIGYIQQRLPCKTVPPKSSAEGNGIINAIVGQRAQFVLTTRNTDGRQCYSERDKVTLEINNQQRHNCMTEVQIEDREDGTYNIIYFVTEAGKLDASVKVNGNHVRGSPFGIQVKDREYKHVLSFGQHGSSAGTLGSPWGVAVNNCDEIAVSEDENDRVQVFRSDGTFLRCFGGFGHDKGKFHYPRGIAFDQNGNILVSDSGNSRVQIFDEHGNYLDTFGEKGSLDSQLKDPSDLIIESDGNIIIADSVNGVVKVFSTTKQILQKIGEKEIFKYPYSCVKYKQYLIVSDYHDDCVKVFDREQGTFLYKFGSVGNGDGQFKHPSCVAVDKAGQLMVCDENNHRIQVFKLNGEFVAKFGSQGSELGKFNLPGSIAVLSDGRIVVSDYANHRIQIFE